MCCIWFGRWCGWCLCSQLTSANPHDVSKREVGCAVLVGSNALGNHHAQAALSQTSLLPLDSSLGLTQNASQGISIRLGMLHQKVPDDSSGREPRRYNAVVGRTHGVQTGQITLMSRGHVLLAMM